MLFRISYKLTLVFLLVVSGVAFLGAKGLGKVHDATTPVVLSVNPTNPAPNSDVLIKVQLSGPSTYDTDVSIGCTDPTAFINLPTDVFVPAGQSSYTFRTRTSSTYSGWVVLAATANGGTALAVAMP